MKYEKNVRIQSCSFQKDLQILFHTVSEKTYIFPFNSKKYDSNSRIPYLDKIYEIHKKRSDEKLFA